MSESQQLTRLQQLLLIELRPTISSKESSKELSLPLSSPEYTTVYSGFFLDGILTVAIDPAHAYEFHFVIESIDYNCGGRVKITREKAESLLAESGGEGLVSHIFPTIEGYYTKLLVKESENEIRH